MGRPKKEEPPVKRVTNLTDAKNIVRDSVTKILRLKTQRKELNASIGEHRARVKNCGVPPAALDLAIRMKEADAEDRQSHDEGYAIARDALGLGLQRSLFDTIASSDDEPRANAGDEERTSHPEDDSDLAGADKSAFGTGGALAAAREHLSAAAN